ncbi:hypothetical protein F5882DRAFT_381407 [Hyaloscypha sp. PMI_1271]|nr:hypothetical protein F5882DRAFT_381407 [Hyaloscypha sp. PMI_1271]
MDSNSCTSQLEVPETSGTSQSPKEQCHPEARTKNPAIQSVNKAPPTLETLPYDLHHSLLLYLDPASSASLAVTCRAIYPLHRNRHGSVPLKTLADSNRVGVLKGAKPFLHEMLRSWMKKDGVGLRYSGYNELFVTMERWLELEEARWSDGWESS